MAPSVVQLMLIQAWLQVTWRIKSGLGGDITKQQQQQFIDVYRPLDLACASLDILYWYEMKKTDSHALVETHGEYPMCTLSLSLSEAIRFNVCLKQKSLHFFHFGPWNFKASGIFKLSGSRASESTTLNFQRIQYQVVIDFLCMFFFFSRLWCVSVLVQKAAN